jgi:hypothetical protein
MDNNPGQGLGHAAIGILKIPFSDTKPASPDSRFPALTTGGEFRYALFPLPDISLVSQFPFRPPLMATTLTFRSSGDKTTATWCDLSHHVACLPDDTLQNGDDQIPDV